MKGKTIRGAALGVLVLGSVIVQAQSVQVTVNGNPVNFPDAQPQTINGRVLVPLRGVFEAIGATVIWDADTQSITANQGDRHVSLQIGDLEANVNGKIVDMDVAPQISGDSTLVPLRFLSQSLGASVDWEPRQNLVAVNTQGYRLGRAQHFDDRPVAPPPVVVPPPPPPVVIQAPVVQPPTIIIEHAPPPPPPPVPHVEFARYSVIPMRLDETLSSSTNHDGDSFTATVVGDHEGYLDLPRGTVVTGQVRRSHPMVDGKPGELELRFMEILLPSGKRYPVSGTVEGLNNPNIFREGGIRFEAKDDGDVRDGIAQDAAVGPGAGLIVDESHHALGGLLGALTPRHHHDLNQQIEKGTKLGLILGDNLRIARHDL